MKSGFHLSNVGEIEGNEGEIGKRGLYQFQNKGILVQQLIWLNNMVITYQKYW